MDIGYARVSSKEQRVDLQVDALKKSGCGKIYTDMGISGAKVARPGLDLALDQLREGDSLVVWRLDRLGRSTRHLLTLIEDLDARGVKFRSLTETIDSGGPMGKVMLTLIAAFAEMERQVLRDRTNAGLEAARARGRKGGRKPLLTHKQDQAVRSLYDARETPISAIADAFGVSEPTVWRSLARTRAVEAPQEIPVTGSPL
jgi:DNA invertase Pin-like site-specific DNA recombinase